MSRRITKLAQTTVSNIVINSIGTLALLYVIKNAYIVQSTQLMIGLIDLIENVIYIILFLNIISKRKFKSSQFLCICILGFILLFCFINTGYAALLRSFLVIFSCYKVNYKKICKKIYNYTILGLVIVIILFLLNISNASVMRRGYISLGFSQANVCSYIIQTICLLNQYINCDKYSMSKRQYFIFPIIGVFDYMIMGSRTSTIIISLSPFIITLFTAFLKNKNLNNFISIIIKLCPLICITITLGTVYFYEVSPIVQFFNILFNTRIFLNYYNYNKYGLSILGQRTSFSDGETLYNPVTGGYSTFNTIDSSYMCLLLQFGLLGTIVWSLSQYFLINRIIVRKQYVLLSITVLLLLFGLIESSIIEIFIDFPLIYLLASDD